MGKVDCLANGGGIEYYWNTCDHEPPHFHAKHTGGEWEIRVYFLNTVGRNLQYDFKFPSNKKDALSAAFRTKILNKIKGKSEELYKEWDKKVKTDLKG